MNNSIAGILGQGVLTRQMTSAQTKGTQIENIEIQQGQQLEQLNMQIQVAQAGVQAAQQIFNISSDRIALENQLVQVQEQLAATQFQSVTALSTLLNQFKNGNPAQSNTSLAALINALQLVTNPAAGVTASPGMLQNIFSQAFQTYSSMGYAGFTGVNLG